jgi:hypothetical protein
MAKNYVYRMDHDTGLAPHASRSRKICILCGCKTTTVEAWAEPGSWIIGIGGKGTGKPDALIYAMQVDATLTRREFRQDFSKDAADLSDHLTTSIPRVLVAKHFFYFGNNAVSLPPSLHHLVIDRQGCKKLANEDVERLVAFLKRKHHGEGVHGSPNNPPATTGKTGCRRRVCNRAARGRRCPKK